MAHLERLQTPVGDSIYAIIAAFTNGLDVCKRLHDGVDRRSSGRGTHRPTQAQSESASDVLELTNSLSQNPVCIRRQYEDSYAVVGDRFAQGDATAHASLAEVLLNLNSGLVAIIHSFLAPEKHDYHPDYKSLTQLSDASSAKAMDALAQLYQRLSQSQLVLDRVRPRCLTCGNHHHQDCAPYPKPTQRRGCVKRVHQGPKPKHRKSQTELVIVRRPRNSARYPVLKTSVSTTMHSRSHRPSKITSASPSVSAPATPPYLAQRTPTPELPCSQPLSIFASDPPPSYSRSVTPCQPSVRQSLVSRKPVVSTVSTTTPQTTAVPPISRAEAAPHGPRPLDETVAPVALRQHQMPYMMPTSDSAAPEVATISSYHLCPPPRLPVSSSTLVELPVGSNMTATLPPPPPPPPLPNKPSVLQRRQPPVPPPKKQHLQSQALPPLPMSSSMLNTHTHHHHLPSTQLSDRATPAPPLPLSMVPAVPQSTCSFSSDSTKLGEIPMRKWARQFDYAALERENTEAASASTVQESAGSGGGRKKPGRLFKFWRRGADY